MFISKSENNRYGLALVDEKIPVAFTGYKGFRDLASMCCPWDLFDIEDETLLANQIFVLPEYRGRGFGQTLLSKLCEVARDKKYRILQIDQPKGELMKWYNKNLALLVNSNIIRGYEFKTEGWNRFLVEL
jgi:GNAT superfamily N-acetyltransferase